MSGTNDFLPFAIDGGAVVLDQPSYAATTPADGQGFGIVPQANYNKQMRQGNNMASAIGMFIALANFNALDNGDISGLEVAFKAALVALIASQVTAATVPPVAAANYNSSTAVKALNVNLFLPAGTWLIQADCNAFCSDYSQQELHVDGTTVQSIPNLGDPDGTCFVTMKGFLTVVITSARNVPIVYVQQAGGDNSPFSVSGIAFKVA